jgi:hypothetical protein
MSRNHSRWHRMISEQRAAPAAFYRGPAPARIKDLSDAVWGDVKCSLCSLRGAPS